MSRLVGNEKFGAKLKAFRKRHGLTQQEVATKSRACGVTCISRIERGRNDHGGVLPELKTQEKLQAWMDRFTKKKKTSKKKRAA
jgi:transcriptional regulator with XRE-family HTH domain